LWLWEIEGHDFDTMRAGVEGMSISKSFFENIEMHIDHLVICGGGHVSIPMITIGKTLGFYVSVLEDRPMFANHARCAGADRVICDTFVDALQQIEGGKDTYFIIVTRGHRYDIECLRSILQKENAYIGMMGSKVRAKEVRKSLKIESFSEEVIEKIYCPIGFDIGGETPEEIAVSIAAQLVQVRSRNYHATYTKEIVEAALDKCIVRRSMATIIERKGSAPRKVGTKMIIFEDGRTAGTIGGGCMEAEVIQKAIMLMHENMKEEIIKLNMLPEQAEEEGMVCGGIIEVRIEKIE